MGTKPQPTDSHPICPTCQNDLTSRKDLAYFVGASEVPPIEDDLGSFYEETSRLVVFLGALAQAGPAAVAFHFAGVEDAKNDYTPEWVSDFTWLAEELTKETRRRLQLLQAAGRIWQKRAELATAELGKEG
jgi:hypothetical protein